MPLDSRVPSGPVAEKWDSCKFTMKLVNPANRRKFSVICVGTGLAGGAASASLAEMGYNVRTFCIQDSARRAHSIAAQGGINAAKNYPNDGDSIRRLFYDTVKGGDYRAREANVYRLAQVSNNIIDQCVAQGVPFAREYSGELANRSFGGAQVSRTFYARGQTGQQLLIGAYQAMMRMVRENKIKLHTRWEMVDLVIVDGRARGIIARDCVTGKLERFMADAVILATGGYGRIFYLSTNAHNSNATAIWRAHRRGAFFANPCYTQIHPTCIPVSGDHQAKLTLMSESLRNDGRVWVPRKKEDLSKNPAQIPEADRNYYLEVRYPAFGNLVPRDVASRAAKQVCDGGFGVGASGVAVYLDFKDAIAREGADSIAAKYGNLFDMYHHITGENPYNTPMRIYPAVHYTMGGLWVDYHLQSTIPGLFVLGEANFSDHGANRLGASALMQGLADGYFVIPYTLSNYLAQGGLKPVATDAEPFKAAEAESAARFAKLVEIGKKGNKTVREFHRELGLIMWNDVGMGRTKAGLESAIEKIRALRAEFGGNLKLVHGGDGSEGMNKNLEDANRLSDYLELGELMARDALVREESCGGHFREEHQTPDGEALRDDEKFAHVAAWEWTGDASKPARHEEALAFDDVHLTQRSYK